MGIHMVIGQSQLDLSILYSCCHFTFDELAHAYRGGRSTVGYSGSSSRSSMSAQDSHGLYSSRQGMSYSGTRNCPYN